MRISTHRSITKTSRLRKVFQVQPPELQTAQIARPGRPCCSPARRKPTTSCRLVDRKYLFIDDAIVAESENVSFNVNPPRPAEKVLDNVNNHLVVWEDDDGLIRMYYRVAQAGWRWSPHATASTGIRPRSCARPTVPERRDR